METSKRKPFGKSERFEQNNTKWITGISQQLEQPTEKINVKCIPISQIKLDPENSRQLLLSREEIEKGPKLQFAEFDDQVQQAFLKTLEDYFSTDPYKIAKINEFMDLAHLAASIKSHTKLINPITVFSKEMDFHLISGHRRTLAHLILNEDKIFARILTNIPDQLEHNLIQWKENKDRQDLTLFDELLNIQKIIKSWEHKNNALISIRKLMSLLSIKKTKASYYLAIIKEFDSNLLMLDAIKTQKITSLELSYCICNMQDHNAKARLLDELLAGKKYNYLQIMAKIKNPELSVRTPDTKKIKVKPFIKITKQSNLDVISKITQILVKSPELKSFQNDFQKINFKSKAGLIVAWEKIYEVMDV